MEQEAEKNVKVRAEKRKKTQAISDKANIALLATLVYQYCLQGPFKTTPLGKVWHTKQELVWNNAMIPRTFKKRPKKEVNKESIHDLAR